MMALRDIANPSDGQTDTSDGCDQFMTQIEKDWTDYFMSQNICAPTEYVIVKKNSTPPSGTQRGEIQVPIKCGDVPVYFTMEEWDYIEENKDLYQKVVMENHQPSSSPLLEEPVLEMCPGDVKAIIVTEEEAEEDEGDEDSQSLTKAEPVDVSSNTYAGELGMDSVSVGQAVEETYVLNSWETSVVHEASCAEADLHKDSYTLSSPSSNMARHNTTSFHGSPIEDSAENFSFASLRHAMDSLVYTSTSEQCEEECAYADHKPADVCEEQNQLYETMNNLLYHQMAHGQSSSVDKPYSCNHCDKRFAKRSYLGQHLKTHTGEKPYACSDCGKRFSRRSNMKSHYKTHTGEKPFACPKCGKCFTHSSNMVRHQRKHCS